MGWFWADDAPATPRHRKSPSGPAPHQWAGDAAPHSSCPVRGNSHKVLGSSCPVPYTQAPRGQPDQDSSVLSKINPLNYMFRDLSQSPAPNQTHPLPAVRDPSSIPKGGGGGNWEYPSPQQMYNALLRKGYTDTDVTAVESMVAVHNFLNEGAWAEVVEWEQRFGRGLSRAWDICRRGEDNARQTRRVLDFNSDAEPIRPTLVRFEGRPSDMTPKAAMFQVMGWLYPEKFGCEPPFDRHDWYVARNVDGQEKLVRYVIDYYSAPPEPTGEPVFYLDVRPALTPTGAVERAMRWAGDFWWRASGGEAREDNQRP